MAAPLFKRTFDFSDVFQFEDGPTHVDIYCRRLNPIYVLLAILQAALVLAGLWFALSREDLAAAMVAMGFSVGVSWIVSAFTPKYVRGPKLNASDTTN